MTERLHPGDMANWSHMVHDRLQHALKDVMSSASAGAAHDLRSDGFPQRAWARHLRNAADQARRAAADAEAFAEEAALTSGERSPREEAKAESHD